MTLCAFNSLVLPFTLFGFAQLFQLLYFNGDSVTFNIAILYFLYFSILGLIFGLAFWAAVRFFFDLGLKVEFIPKINLN